jgi:dihydroorotate dehydrogenase
LYQRLRPLLFRLDPERAHALTLFGLRLVGALPPLQAMLRRWYPVTHQPVQVFGLEFINPVGLAAGYDKDGLGWRGLACLGFSHIEVGTVTPRPQPGNPRPRLFRLPEDRALINRMGFPGMGADYVLQRLAGRRPPGLVLGVNLGKNQDTPLEDAAQDYLALMRKFAPAADYLAINVSSPNTVGLRRLQARDALEALLKFLVSERDSLHEQSGKRTPLLLKLAPDLSETELDDALQVSLECGIDGLIATNTTLERDGLHSPRAGEAGGLSGAPLGKRSLEITRWICTRTEGRLPLISVGGILSAADAIERLDAGAALVQVYTGLVYAGPALPSQIVNNIR